MCAHLAIMPCHISGLGNIMTLRKRMVFLLITLERIPKKYILLNMLLELQIVIFAIRIEFIECRNSYEKSI